MKKTLITGFALVGLLVAGCSADKTDFKAAAEKTIREDVEKNIEGDATADCDDPGATKVGTTFSCLATAGDGSTYTYIAEITGEKEVTVNFEAVGDPATATTTS